MVAEFESDLIRLRTREGMKVAKAQGRLRPVVSATIAASSEVTEHRLPGSFNPQALGSSPSGGTTTDLVSPLYPLRRLCRAASHPGDIPASRGELGRYLARTCAVPQPAQKRADSCKVWRDAHMHGCAWLLRWGRTAAAKRLP
jgi:hypothetical protein